MNRIKVFEMFAGFGGASFSLKELGVDFEVVGFSEIDKYAIQCYKQNHKKSKNYGDCTKINAKELPEFDILTGGFPCQAFSGAGKGLGELDTRGTLVYDIIRIAEEKQPKYMLLENVKGFTFKKFKNTFDKVLSELNRIGYDVHHKVTNAKDFGVPQNRERIWFVCIRKDLNQGFEFPQEQELDIYLKDILEDEVDEKYYLKNSTIKKIVNWKAQEKPLDTLNNNISKCLRARGQSDLHSGLQLIKTDDNKTICLNSKINGVQPKIQDRIYSINGIMPSIVTCFMPNIHITRSGYETNDSKPEIGQAKRVYGTNGVSPPLNCGWIPIINNTKKGYIEARQGDGISFEQLNSKTRRGRVILNLSPTLQCNDLRGTIDTQYRIRKLTPRECFRLQGFLQDEINLDNLSDAQKSKLAGNGWCIKQVVPIFKNMLVNKKPKPKYKKIINLFEVEE